MRRFRMGSVAIAMLVSVGLRLPAADKPDPTLLTLDRIFQGSEFDPQSVPAYQWSRRRGGYTSLDKPAEGAGRDLVWHDTGSDRTEVWVPAHHFIPPGEESPLAIESYTFSDDESKLLIYTQSKRVWRTRARGDYWVLNVASHELRKIGGDAPPSSLMYAQLSPDGSRVAYVMGNNLYVQDLRSGQVTPLTTDGSPTRFNGVFDWVYEEELGLHRGFRWSPDSQWIAYWQIDDTGVREFQLVHNLEGLYSRIQTIPYPKAGETNPAGRVGVVSAFGGQTAWIAVPGDAREHYIAQLDWAGDADHIVLQQFNRLQNTNLLLLYHRKSGELRTLVTETDKAWVENSNSHLTWINDHHSLLWLSEREGWQHVYRIERKDGRTEAVTHGSFDVLSIDGRDERGGWLYYTASPDNPTQRYLYRVRWDGQETSRVSPDAQPGTHTYDLSPDARWAVHSYSTFDKPPVTALISLPDHKVVRVLADNRALQKKLKALKPTPSEFFRVDIGDGVQLDGWCVLPAGFDPGRKYPALIYVYGEPAGQTVLDRWTGKRQLWHRLLAQQGYLVFSFDNRGTPAPRGSAWRKSIYRQAGVLAAADQAAALRATAQARPYLDAQRVAIWGWSGGGSMTLNAILRYPDLYQAAMAVAPVPNLTFYDTIYEERYMGLPSDNAEGYRLGSAVTFARQLEGELLIVHGTGDDNVHYQGTETLIDELIAYNKQFSAFAYPSRSHSISERKNTTRHLYGLLTRFLHDKIDAGAR